MKNKKVKDLIHSIGLKHNLRDEKVLEVVKSEFEFAKDTIDQLNKKGLNRETKRHFKGIVFHYKRLGKIYLNNNYDE
ncbi:MAG: hypothetical protein ACTH0S_06620 [Senegalia sp. (in: firmicutes)]